MSDVIGRGVIEVSADSSKLNAAIAEARRSIAGLGGAQKDASEKASRSIDNYIKRIQLQNTLHGRSAREVELYKLSLKGATDEQLRAANAALKLGEAQARMDRLRAMGPMVGAAIASGFIAATVAVDQLIKKTADFQDLSEKVGDTAENMASLSISAGVANVSMDEVANLAVKLSKNLVGVDDESKAAGAAIKALGLDIGELRKLGAADRLETIAKALDGFADSASKGDVAVALLGRSGADALPFLKELAQEGGRQVILTNEQIKAADEYADRQARLRGELSLYAQQIAMEALPLMSDFTQALTDIARDAEFAATASDILKGAFKGGVLIFQTIALVGSDIAFTFKAIGTEIGGMLAALDRLARWDIKGMNAIDEAVKADIAKARAELDRFQAEVRGIGEPKAQPLKPSEANVKAFSALNSSVDAFVKRTEKPTIAFNGATPRPKSGGGSSVDQEAKAQLARDLADIKAAGAEIASAYANAEKVMEARRAAGLVNEREYYEAKLGFLRLNADAQSRALLAEIGRLEAEKATGKQRVDNERAITDAKVKLAKIQEDLAANTEVLAIQDTAAVDRLAKSYLDAASAAQAYIDTVKRQNQREIEGIGRGNKFRERQEGRNAIEDKFTERRQSLEGDLRRNEISTADYEIYLKVARDTYAEEVRLFEDRTARIDQLQRDGLSGMTEALNNYADEARDISSQVNDAFTNALQGLEDTLVEFATGGKASFKDLGNAIAKDVARIGIKSMIGQASEFILGKVGIKSPEADKQGAQISLAAQTASIDANKIALDAMAAAANSAAAALQSIPPGGGAFVPPTGATLAGGSGLPAPIDGELAGVTDEAAGATKDFGTNALSAASDLTRLAASAGIGGDAMTRLPGIIGLFQSAVAAMSLSGGKSGGGGLIGSIFSAIAGSFAGGGGASTGSSMIASAFGGREYHTGGIVGASTGASRAISSATIANATRYHTGGIAGLKADEVPAVLMGGPKGKREEVLTADDPRHRDNLGARALELIARESKHEGLRVKGARELGGPVSANSMYRVNEKRPELLEVAGKQYLMTGAQGGKVTDPGAATKGGDTIIHVQVSPPQGATRSTAQQFGAAAAREMQRALSRN